MVEWLWSEIWVVAWEAAILTLEGTKPAAGLAVAEGTCPAAG